MRRIAVGLFVVALAGCGSSSVKTVTVSPGSTSTPAPSATVTVTAPARTAAPAPAPASVPVMIAGSWNGPKPSEIDFSGDAGNIVTGISWSSWTATGAIGQGTSNVQGCVPNCAQGSETPVATSITLSSPQSGHFTQIVETRNGQTLTASYPGQDWPQGASG